MLAWQHLRKSLWARLISGWQIKGKQLWKKEILWERKWERKMIHVRKYNLAPDESGAVAGIPNCSTQCLCKKYHRLNSKMQLFFFLKPVEIPWKFFFFILLKTLILK